MTEHWRERYAEKVCSAEQAISHIPVGHRIFIGSGAAEPAVLVDALVRDSARFADNDIVHILTLGPAPYVAPGLEGRFRHTAFFIGPNVRDAVQSGRADFMPVFLSEIPALMRSRRVMVDVALLQVSPPDARGYVSLGVSVDVVLAALEVADLVIAQVNPHMPRTLGASLVPVSKLDYLVDAAAPLFELAGQEPDPVTSQIGELVASLVSDGATLQAGIGRIPDATLRALHDRHDLGVHTEMFSDGMVAINSALSVDLTGQVAADTVGGRFFSGIGGQVDFIRGAARSQGGSPSDEDALQDLLYRLSDESTFFRFFAHTCTHPHGEVLHLAEIDGGCGVALVARVAETDELTGIARADMDPRSGTPELGVTIADSWQGKGLGTLLLQNLTSAAKKGGFLRLTAEVLPSNHRLQRLLRRHGFTCSGEPGDNALQFQLALGRELAA